jgi:hypothetical protein
MSKRTHPSAATYNPKAVLPKLGQIVVVALQTLMPMTAGLFDKDEATILAEDSAAPHARSAAGTFFYTQRNNIFP